jgi:hypothetical protein
MSTWAVAKSNRSIYHERAYPRVRRDLSQQFEPFADQLIGKMGEAGFVCTRPAQCPNKSFLDWVFAEGEDDGDGRGLRFWRQKPFSAASSESARKLQRSGHADALIEVTVKLTPKEALPALPLLKRGFQ